MIDIVSVKGCLHIGQLTIGLSSAQRLCQASEIEIRTKNRMPVQIDGEPWGQKECTFKVTKKKDQGTMLHRANKNNGGDIATEMTNLLDWAEINGIIKKAQHNALMKEFSRRVETKAREKKRTTSTDNLLSYGMSNVNRTLKKGRDMMSMMDQGFGKAQGYGQGQGKGGGGGSYEFSTDQKNQEDDDFERDCVIA